MNFEEFILAHESDDTAALLLARHRYPDIDLDLAVTTIQARRRLRKKLPSWYANPALVYPSRLSAEQCSSEETARYKALAASNFECLSNSRGRCWFETNSLPPQRRQNLIIADLTGGMGVDSWAFSQVFDQVLYNEMQTELAEETERNFVRLGCKNITVRKEEVRVGRVKEIHGDFVPDVIYLDPARRAEDGRKVFRLEDCQPDVRALMPELFDACPNILLKLSPMADISYLARELPGLKAVHIVGADGECKELLLQLQKGHEGPYALIVYDSGATLYAPAAAATEGCRFRGTPLSSFASAPPTISFVPLMRNSYLASPSPCPSPGVDTSPETTPSSAAVAGALLFEPGKALAKAGLFKEIGEWFGLEKAGVSTHLYFGEVIPQELKPFGKTFEIEEVLPLDGQVYKSLRKRIPQAEITARNLPLSSDQLRKKLGIASGGTQHLFAFPAPSGGGKLLLITHPIS